MRRADACDVSFLLTAYDVDRDIATAVQSVWDTIALLRGHRAEVIVVDDGSGDRTPAVLQALERVAGDRPLDVVRFSQNTMGGVGIAANVALDRARGRTVVFLDGDDWVCPEALARAVDRMAKGELDLLVTDCAEYWNDTGLYTEWPEHRQWQVLEAGADDVACRKALLHMAPFPWRKLYRRAFLEARGIRFPEGDFFFEDNPFHWETAVKAERWHWLRTRTHIHRRARTGQSLERRDRGYLRILDHYDTIAEMLREAGADSLYSEDLADWLVHHIPWCAGRLAAADWNDLFDAARARLAARDEAAVWAALRRSGADGTGIRQLTALHLGDRVAFLREYELAGGRDPRAQDRG